MTSERGRAEKVYLSYARQSLGRSGDHGDSVSVADQHRHNVEAAERRGGRIVARYQDVDVSGAVEAREGLDAMLADLARLKPAGVVIRDVSRLARDTRLFLSLMSEIQKQQIELISSTENIEDRTIATIISAMAERERLTLAGRVAGGMREHVRRGKTFGRAPFGYRRIDREMLIFAPEAEVVRQVFAWFAAGDSVTMILNKLNGDPLMPKPPETPLWRHSTVAKMLRRPVYRGAAVMSERRDIAGRLWPAVATEDAHPAIVEPELWERANRRFREPIPVIRTKLVSPLSGLLWCAACGARLYAVEQKRPHRPTDLRMARCGRKVYASREGHAWDVCPGRRASMALERVEAASYAAVDAVMDRGPVTDVELNASIVARQAAQESREDLGLVRKKLTDIERRRSRLLDAYERGGLELMTWRERDEALRVDEAALRARLASVDRGPDMDALRAVRAALLADRPDARSFLMMVGGRIVFDLDTATARVVIDGDYAVLFGMAA